MGDFYLRMGDGDSAIREYKEGIAKDPKKKSTYQKRVIEVLMRQGKRSEAAEVNTQILKDDPDDNDARGLAATFLLDKGDIAKALAELQAVVTRAPDNPVSRYNLGRAHAARGEWEQARQQFAKAIELRPDYVMARLALAQLQVTRGEFDAALKTAEAVLAIDRGNVNARLIESAALMGQKKFGDSRAMLDAMLKANPEFARRAVPVGRGQPGREQVQGSRGRVPPRLSAEPGQFARPDGHRGNQHGAEQDRRGLEDSAGARATRRRTGWTCCCAMGNTAVRAGKYDLAIQTFNKVLAAGQEARRKAICTCASAKPIGARAI